MSTSDTNAGRDNRLYINNRPETPLGGSGTFGTPNWYQVHRIGDLTQSKTKTTYDLDVRESDSTLTGYAAHTEEISFTYYKRKGEDDDVFNTFKEGFENGLCLDVALAEDDIESGPTYYDRGPYGVEELEKSEPISGVEAYEITLSKIYTPIFYADPGIGKLIIGDTFYVGL